MQLAKCMHQLLQYYVYSQLRICTCIDWLCMIVRATIIILSHAGSSFLVHLFRICCIVFWIVLLIKAYKTHAHNLNMCGCYCVREGLVCTDYCLHLCELQAQMQYQSDCSIFKTAMGSSAIASFLIRLFTTFPAEVYSVTEYGGHYAKRTKVNHIHRGQGWAQLCQY